MPPETSSWSLRDLSQQSVDLAHDALIGIQAADHLLLSEAHPEGRVDLLCLFGPVDFLRDALDLAGCRVGSLPYSAKLVQRADVQADLLAQVLLVLNEVERPLRQVDYGRHGDDTGEEVRVRQEGHGVRDHL